MGVNKRSQEIDSSKGNKKLTSFKRAVAEAIGKSKEFIESCCKTILEESRVAIDKDWNVSLLVKATMKLLEISTDNIDNSTSESRTVKAILGNLYRVAGNIAEKRRLIMLRQMQKYDKGRD